MLNLKRKNTATFALSHPVLRVLQSIKRGLLEIALPNGVRIICEGAENGPQANIEIRDFSILDRIISHGDIGLGEGYVLRQWDTRNLKTLMQLLAHNYDVLQSQAHGMVVYKILYAFRHKLRPNSRKGSRKNIHTHYDLGNDFYSLWLDETFTYSSALFEGDETKSLEVAQKAKYQRILNRIDPSPSDHILEIGCGWGGLMEQAAKRGCHVTGVTISTAQAKFAQEHLRKECLDHLANVQLQDYREVSQQFDHIVSIGMMEHVGEKYWPEYMANIYDCLRPGGKAMIQTIVIQDSLFDDYRKSSDFIREHIFPGGMLPSPRRIKEEAKKANLKVCDIFPFGVDYAITLEKWLARFDDRVCDIMALGYSDDFIRKWRFYLTSCAAMFRAGKIDVLQVELTKPNNRDAMKNSH